MDLTNCRHIKIEVTKQHGGHWHYIAHCDGREVCQGVAADPDEAVDAAEAHMWPHAEAEEHGTRKPPTASSGSAELPEQNEPQASGAVPTAKQLWDSEARRRADQKSALEKL